MSHFIFVMFALAQAVSLSIFSGVKNGYLKDSE
jgi:hypothetical protein